MSQSKPPRQKPVTLEKRKNLLYSSNKRRSVKAIILLSVIALAVGLAIAYVLRGIVVIDGSALHGRDKAVAQLMPPTPPGRFGFRS